MQLRNLIIGLLLMLLGFGGVHRCTTLEGLERIAAAKESQLKKSKDGQSASQAVIVAQADEILKLRAGAYQDSIMIADLQAAVKGQPKGTKSATVVRRNIKVKASGKTAVFSADTARAVVVSADGLTTGSVTVTKDSAVVDLTIKDRLAFYQVDERATFFGPKIPTVHVNNLAQNVDIVGVRSYQVAPPGPKIGKGWIFAGGFLLGAGTLLYLSR